MIFHCAEEEIMVFEKPDSNINRHYYDIECHQRPVLHATLFKTFLKPYTFVKVL
jgi:hypothetical protein